MTTINRHGHQICPAEVVGSMRQDPKQALTLALAATVGAVLVLSLGWLLMFGATYRLSPQPGREMLAALASASGGAAPINEEVFKRGRERFLSACTACHGPDGKGMPNLGKDLTASEFVASKSDDELLTFVKTGRPMWDPLNTTKVDMPPKGGNPALQDDHIRDIIAYIRGLQALARSGR